FGAGSTALPEPEASGQPAPAAGRECGLDRSPADPVFGLVREALAPPRLAGAGVDGEPPGAYAVAGPRRRGGSLLRSAGTTGTHCGPSRREVGHRTQPELRRQHLF